MASLLLLGALCALPLTHAHMQMIIPSPFRDPHSHRASEPKDYDILKPLHADGSDFACKGYHLNTPWTTVATYEAGQKYKMQLQGSATHGGGSCQISMSFDGGSEFKVIKSMEGGCPMQKQYEFTVPPELGRKLKGKTTGLLAWTWFNKIGNREMYMNCAAIDVVPKGRSKRDAHEPRTLDPRDTATSNAAAQSALSSYPPLFVANLAKVNDCITKETQDVVFDTPGNSVDFADGKSRSAKSSFTKGRCTGRGTKDAGSSSSSSSSPPPPSSPGGGSSSPGNNGQWKPEKQQTQSSSGSCANANDGQYHPECIGGQSNEQKAINVSPKPAPAKPVQHVKIGSERSTKIVKELNAYLATLYSGSEKSKRSECQNVKGTCHTPNRWVKRGECVWECSRKGRRSPGKGRHPNHGPDTVPDDENSMGQPIQARHSTDIPVTVPDILNSMGQPVQARQVDTITDDPLPLTDDPLPLTDIPLTTPTPEPAPAPTHEQQTFDLFLTYLSRLQSTVIECIRGITMLSPTSIPKDTSSIIPETLENGGLGTTEGTPPPGFIGKRQLIVPDLSVKGFNITSTPVGSIPSSILSALTDVVQGIGKVFGAPRPMFSPWRGHRNVTFTMLNGSTTTDIKPDFLPFPLGHRPALPSGVPLNWPGPPWLNPFASTTTSSPSSVTPTTTDIWPPFRPFHFGHGPVVPSGVSLDWRGPLWLYPITSTTTSSPSSTASSPVDVSLPTPTNVAQLLPWLTGPGPVIPPGTIIDGLDDEPGNIDNLEHMPMVVDDLGKDAEKQIKQFFDNLKKEAEDDGGV